MKKQTLLFVALMGAMPAVYSADGADQQQGWFESMGNKFSEWTKTSPYLSQSVYGGGGVVVGLSLAAYFANKASKHAKAMSEARTKLAVDPKNQEAQNAFNHHAKWRDIHYSMLAAATSAAVVGGGVLGHGVISHVRGSKAVADLLPAYDESKGAGEQFDEAGEELFERGDVNRVRAGRAQAFNFLSRLGQQQGRSWWQRLLNPFYAPSVKDGDDVTPRQSSVSTDGSEQGDAVVDALRSRYHSQAPSSVE